MSDMSRTEAIKILKLAQTDKYYGTSEQLCEAWNMAIASLETDEAYQLEYERTTKNDLGVDAISRDEVCRYVAEFVNHEFSTREEEELIDNIITGIEHMPPATPQEPRKGHWISHKEHCKNLGVMPSGLGAYEWCSNCDCGIDVKEYHRNHYNYCPNCGAKMVELQKSEG